MFAWLDPLHSLWAICSMLYSRQLAERRSPQSSGTSASIAQVAEIVGDDRSRHLPAHSRKRPGTAPATWRRSKGQPSRIRGAGGGGGRRCRPRRFVGLFVVEVFDGLGGGRNRLPRGRSRCETARKRAKKQTRNEPTVREPKRINMNVSSGFMMRRGDAQHGPTLPDAPPAAKLIDAVFISARRLEIWCPRIVRAGLLRGARMPRRAAKVAVDRSSD